MTIYIDRYEFTRNETWGKLSIPSEKFLCDTLEDEARPRGVKIKHHTCISSGIYNILLTMSARFKKVLPIIFNTKDDYSVRDGAGVIFTGIRIHGGVRAEHPSGCVIVGVRVDNLMQKSPNVMESLMEILEGRKDEGIQLCITNKQRQE
jgi:hypothetical protein